MVLVRSRRCQDETDTVVRTEVGRCYSHQSCDSEVTGSAEDHLLGSERRLKTNCKVKTKINEVFKLSRTQNNTYNSVCGSYRPLEHSCDLSYFRR